jgi:hypothetical protein
VTLGVLAALPAHGVGSREDLPLPFSYLLVGAGLALVISFVALGALWKAPRLRDTDGRLVPKTLALALDSPALRGIAVLATLFVAAWTLMSLVFGKDNANNPVASVVYVWLWVGLAFLSMLVGGVWRLVNPLRWLHAGLLRLARVEPDFALAEYRWGYWPAAVGLAAFVWLELIAPDNADLPVLRVAVFGYLLVGVILSLVFGRPYLRRGDAFAAWSSLYGTLSPLGRRADGRWVWRTPLHGPLQVGFDRGLLAVCAVLLGTTAYDGFSNESRWYGFVQGRSFPRLWETAGLLGVCLVVAGSLALAAWLSARLAKVSWHGVASAFAPSLIPIAAGYLIAHYWSLWVWEGTNGLAKFSDPLGTGGNWLGTAGVTPAAALITPSLVAAIQVIAIITGHVLGVVVAHERALALFPRRAAVAGQVPLLVLMVVYTVGGLTLLFSS